MTREEISMIMNASTSLCADAARLEYVGLKAEMESVANGEYPSRINFNNDTTNSHIITATGFSEDFRLFPQSVTIYENGEIIVSGIDDNGTNYDVDADELYNGDARELYDAIEETLNPNKEGE